MPFPLLGGGLGSSAPAPVRALTITIVEWVKRARIVSFLLVVPERQQIVTITATLTDAHGHATTAIVRAVDANVVTAVQLPAVAPGRYRLTLTAIDNSGGTVTASRAIAEVV